MSSPTSVIRRYTPPTCTLEIAAKESPLSRWMGQSALKHLRFKLSFDDPRVPDSNWVTVHGDRTQLQALSDAVTAYVQNFLSQSATYFNRSNPAVATAEPATELNPAGIYLQPKGLVSHELHLGSLATENSGSIIRLSAVQLADLASALDEYAAEATALPNLERPRWIKTAPAWGTIAAAAVVAIGVFASMARVFEPAATQTASNSAPSSNDQRLAVQPLPTPTPSPFATLPSSPLPLTSPPPNPAAPTTTPSSPTASNSPQQMPNIRVEQQPPVDAPPPEIQIPVREVPVAALPDQTQPSESQARSAAPNPAAAEPVPPAAIASKDTASPEANQTGRATLQASPSGTMAARSNVGTIPQVAEAKSFFQSRWQPPKELTQAIEYQLVLAPDGKIQRIIPLGETADRFLDRTPMPVSDEPFVSPIKGGPPTIRLILSPNGNVQAFLEKMDQR
mgnify:CR=1 FL=1